MRLVEVRLVGRRDVSLHDTESLSSAQAAAIAHLLCLLLVLAGGVEEGDAVLDVADVDEAPTVLERDGEEELAVGVRDLRG